LAEVANAKLTPLGGQIAMFAWEAKNRTATELESMGIRHLSAVCGRAKRLIMLALLGGTAFAQGTSIAKLADGPPNFSVDSTGPTSSFAAATSPAAVSPSADFLPEAPSRHKFWDNENRVLFAAVAALSAADFAVTRANLQNGGKELDPVTRILSGSTVGLAVNFAGETAGIVGLSYVFHKTGHHQLERIMPMLNIGGSSFAVVYDLSHR
jgi:hypothetical protein